MDSIKEWMAFIGRRNIAYVVFVSLLVPFGMAMEAAGPQGPDSALGALLCAVTFSSKAQITGNFYSVMKHPSRQHDDTF